VATFKDFKATSPDGDLEIIGRVEFHDPVATSEVKLCVRFRLDQELLQRSGFIRLILGPASVSKLPDGRYQNRLEGRFGHLKGSWTSTCPYETAPPPLTAEADRSQRMPPTS